MGDEVPSFSDFSQPRVATPLLARYPSAMDGNEADREGHGEGNCRDCADSEVHDGSGRATAATQVTQLDSPSPTHKGGGDT